MGLTDVPCVRGARQAWGEMEGVAPVPEPHNSVCPWFCPDLGRAEPPGVRRVGFPGAWTLSSSFATSSFGTPVCPRTHSNFWTILESAKLPWGLARCPNSFWILWQSNMGNNWGSQVWALRISFTKLRSNYTLSVPNTQGLITSVNRTIWLFTDQMFCSEHCTRYCEEKKELEGQKSWACV